MKCEKMSRYFGFGERGKPEYSGKISEQRRGPRYSQRWKAIKPVHLLFTINCFLLFYIFIAECSLPPKIKTTILILHVLVQWSSKELGGITLVIHPISTDSTLVDHTYLMLMVSSGTLSEVNIIP